MVFLATEITFLSLLSGSKKIPAYHTLGICLLFGEPQTGQISIWELVVIVLHWDLVVGLQY